MRKALLSILVLFTIAASAQTYTPVSGRWEYMFVKWDSVAHMPYGDTATFPKPSRPGAIMMHTDKVFYKWNGGGWEATIKATQLNDSMFIVGRDTITIKNIDKENIIGQIFNSSNFTSISGFSNNGATVSATGGHLSLSGGNPNTQSIDLDSFRAIENWVVSAKIKPTVAGAGPGIGWRGFNVRGSVSSLMLGMNTSTGTVTLYTGAYTSTKVASSTLSFSLNDTIEMTIEYAKTVVTCKVRNLTTNSAAISFTYNFYIPNGWLPIIGKFSVWNNGGSFDLDSLSVFSNVAQNPKLILVGDSKHRGYMASSEGLRTGDLLNNLNRSTVILASSSDLLEDMINRYKEIRAIAGPRTKVILGGCANNISYGQSSTTYLQLYDSLVNLLSGLDVYHITGLYQPGIDQSTFRSHVYATYPQSKIIETLIPTMEPGLLYGDNIHLNDAGQQVEYDAIVRSMKLSNQNTQFKSNSVISNQYSILQPGFFNLSGYGYIDGSNYTSVRPAFSTKGAIGALAGNATAFPLSLSAGLPGTIYSVNTGGNWGIVSARATNDIGAPFYTFYKTRGTDGNLAVSVAANDGLGLFEWHSVSGNGSIVVAGSAGMYADSVLSSSIASRFVWNTTNKSGSTAERMRLFSSGNLSIGSTVDNGAKLQVNGSSTFSGLMQLNGVTNPPSTYNVLVHSLADSGTYQVPVTSIVPTVLRGVLLSFSWGSLAANSAATTTVTVTGAAVGDIVQIAPSDGSADAAGEFFDAKVTGADTVTIRRSNTTDGGMSSGTRSHNIMVFKY